jgi:hypothetical protein
MCSVSLRYKAVSSTLAKEVNTDQWRTQEFCSGGGSTNSVEDRVQRERGSGGSGPLVRGSGDSCNLVFQVGFEPPKPPSSVRH